MDNFDFMDLLEALREKGYELRLYPGERDEFHMQLTHWDWKTGRRFNAKYIANLNFIKAGSVKPNVVLGSIIQSLLFKLDHVMEEGRPDEQET